MVGNRVFGHALILCICTALLMAPWGSLEVKTPESEDVATPVLSAAKAHSRTALAAKRSLALDLPSEQPSAQLVHGWQGKVAIGQVAIPFWLIIVSLSLGSVTAIGNLLSWTRLSSVVTFACFGFAAACSLVANIDFAYHGALGTGSLLAIACALVGLSISPSDEPIEEIEIHQMTQERRQLRSAA
jgi:hypothetical protein